jgi:hypothetical protein
MSELKLYRPANGTEGMIFEAHFCDRCVHDENQDCDIHNRALVYGENEPEYPREWQYDEDGDPVCIKFATEIPPPTRAELEEAGQGSLLPATLPGRP